MENETEGGGGQRPIAALFEAGGLPLSSQFSLSKRNPEVSPITFIWKHLHKDISI